MRQKIMKEPDNTPYHLQLDRVAFYGRTLREYLKFFDIDLALWKGYKILDCSSGTSSFVAEANKEGIHAVGCDPLYSQNLDSLVRKGESDIDHVIERVSRNIYIFRWDFYTSVDTLKEYRIRALRCFQEDYPVGIKEGRYIQGELPKLPFADQSFDMVLSGHFLFLYSDRFDYSFHLNSVLELVRVCSKEVRIYPLVQLNTNIYKCIEHLLYDLEKEGIRAEISPVAFEFQRGAYQMLRLIR